MMARSSLHSWLIIIIKMKQVQAPRSDSSSRSDRSDKSIDDEQEAQEINAPRVDRNLSYEPDFGHIVINTAFTHYPVVREAAVSLGMKAIEEAEQRNWDLCWTDLQVTPHTFIRMHFHQSINYIPGIYTIARKNELGRNLNAMRSHFPLDYNFHPPTWMLPEDYHLLRKHFESPRSKNEIFIVKPQAECQGRGIYLVNKLEEIEIGKHCVVQRYVPNPLLIQGYKFDLRVYVLIGSIDPLRIYIFNDGLGRFATEGYQAPQQSNFRSNYQHLTNYAINKLNPKFKAAMSGEGEGGFKRSLQAVMKLLREMGADTELLWTRIKEISVKTIITSYEHIKHNYLSSQPQEYQNRMAFHILGLDVLITDTLQPVLLQVNHTPSFATETQLDHRIKYALIRDTLKLMRLDSLQLKKELFNKAKAYSNNRIEHGKRQSLNEEVREKELASNLQQRISFQKNNLGGYEVIFPFQDQQKNTRFNVLIDKAKTILYSRKKKAHQHKKVRKQSRQIKELKDPRQPKQFLKESQKQLISDYSTQLKSTTRDIRNHSMYNQRIRPDTQIIQDNINTILKKEHLYQPRHLLFNLHSRNSRTFTIKTKHSLIDMVPKMPLKEEVILRREKERPAIGRQLLKQGNFLKPKTYDVPTLRDYDEPRVIHRKKDTKPIYF